MSDGYFELDRTKRFLLIAEDDTTDDKLLNDIGKGCANRLRSHLATIVHDIPTGDAITDDMKNAVSYDACRKYKLVKRSFQSAEEFMKERDDARKGIDDMLKRNVDEQFVVVDRF